jgi:ssDNA-binding Zn-finger/Zn-ribbon topoisomerase 1
MAVKTKGPWTKEAIIDLINTREDAVLKGIVIIYNRQTTDEQVTRDTKYLNGRGFNGFDAEFGSSLAVQVIDKHYLSIKQMEFARRLLRKYAGQLAEVANEKAQDGTGSIPQKHLEKSYEASDLGGKCPGCDAELNLTNWRTDQDNDITHWDYTCGTCNATYAIFND